MSVALLPPDTGPTTAELLAALSHLGMHAMDGLMMEGVLFQAVADGLGTPAWVVLAGHVRGQIAALRRALDEAGLGARIHYAMKANDLAAVLHLVGAAGAGADGVSGGELHRALRARLPPGHARPTGVKDAGVSPLSAAEAGSTVSGPCRTGQGTSLKPNQRLPWHRQKDVGDSDLRTVANLVTSEFGKPPKRRLRIVRKTGKGLRQLTMGFLDFRKRAPFAPRRKANAPSIRKVRGSLSNRDNRRSEAASTRYISRIPLENKPSRAWA